MSVIVKRVENDFELQGILDLQQANLRINIGADTAASQGFLTAEYTLAFLKAMNDVSPSIIAKDGDEVVESETIYDDQEESESISAEMEVD